jgi:hypothetical protein
MNDPDKKLQLSLLFLRLTVFLVMFMWTMHILAHREHSFRFNFNRNRDFLL